MIDGALETLASIKFHVVVFLGGIALLYSAIFVGIPSAHNGWKFIPREDPVIVLLWAGGGAIVASIALSMVNAEGYNNLLFPSRRIRREHGMLSRTQQELMRAFYVLHRSEMSFDDFYKCLLEKEAGELADMQKDEVLYRLKDLYRVRLIAMKSKGPKSTVLKIKPGVARVLDYPT